MSKHLVTIIEIFKNPVATLEGISINVLYAFFDWLLRERKWCGKFFANILERVVPRAETRDGLSPARSAYQEPDARSIAAASRTKPSLTIIR